MEIVKFEYRPETILFCFPFYIATEIFFCPFTYEILCHFFCVDTSLKYELDIKT